MATSDEFFVAGIWKLQQKMGFSDRLQGGLNDRPLFMSDPLGTLWIGLSQFGKFLQNCQRAFRRAERTRKKNIYLGTLVLTLGVGMFFLPRTKSQF